MFNICINWVWAQARQARQASQFVGPLPKRNTYIKLKKKEAKNKKQAEKQADTKKKQLKSSQNSNNNHRIMAEE